MNISIAPPRQTEKGIYVTDVTKDGKPFAFFVREGEGDSRRLAEMFCRYYTMEQAQKKIEEDREYHEAKNYYCVACLAMHEEECVCGENDEE